MCAVGHGRRVARSATQPPGGSLRPIRAAAAAQDCPASCAWRWALEAHLVGSFVRGERLTNLPDHSGRFAAARTRERAFAQKARAATLKPQTTAADDRQTCEAWPHATASGVKGGILGRVP